MNACIIDIESNDLYPNETQIWTICIKRIGGGSITINPFRIGKQKAKEQILRFIFEEPDPIIIGHNILGFDLWVLWKDLDIDIHVGKDAFAGRSVTFYDTLFASQFTYPDREGGHSLENWGHIVGTPKMDYRSIALQLGIIQPNEMEFCRWSPQMDEYCLQDLEITEQVYLRLSHLTEGNAFKLGQKNFFLMNAQEFTGFKFDIKLAQELKPRIDKMIDDLKREVEPNLPKRKLKKAEESYYSIPAKPFNKDGKFSATMLNFIERHKAKVHGTLGIEINGLYTAIRPGLKVIDGLPMEIDDQKELKEYFLSIGWEPTLLNLKKDSSGKPVREKGKIVQTSPKIQENGKICPNLLLVDGELPKKIVRFLSLRNRGSVLQGWMGNPRLKKDGRLPAGKTGIASTHRQKHNVIVNVPKAQDDVLLGKEFRSLFTVEPGFKLVGCDQAALEARCEAHWVYSFPGGIDRANLLLTGDLHSTNAKIFYPEETKDFDINSAEFSKDDPKFKPYRSASKNGGYALSYGATPKKLAQTLRKPEHEAEKLYNAYWIANPSLKALKDHVESEWEKNDKKWIAGIDGRRLYSRSKHSLVNLLFQSTGAIIVDYAVCLFDMKMGKLFIDNFGRPFYRYKGRIVRRVQYFHDEFGAEVQQEIAEEVATIMRWCMTEAGVRLNLNVPLVGEAKIGNNWCETH